jgi:lysophospholipase L1-like esterase
MSIRQARIARPAGPGAIAPGTDRPLTFAGSSAMTILPGRAVWSDPVALQVSAFDDIAVTLHIDSISTDVTGHPGSRATSFLQAGDHAASATLPNAVKTEHWYILSGIEVERPVASSVVVTLGNSITDGRGSVTDGNTRWPDFLARRLQADARTRDVGVLNAGIGGNAVVRGGLGPTALSRLERDVLTQRGARWLIVLEGVNDIGGARNAAEAAQVAADLIAAYREIIAKSRAGGIRAYGATILPFGGSQYDDSARESARQTVNRWIRSSREWDAVVDFDSAMRDPGVPRQLRTDVDGGDHLHPNPNGYRVMADAIELGLFTTSSVRPRRGRSTNLRR